MVRLIVLIGMIVISLFNVDTRTSPDSLGYLSAAESLPWGYPADYYNWGPLFPALLALFGVNPWLLNATLVSCLIGTVSWLFWDKRFYTWFIVVAVTAVSQNTQYIYSMVWSEGPFLVFCILFLVAWSHYLERRTAQTLAFSSLLLTAALLTRHIGVVLFAVCLTTLLQHQDSWASRIRILFAVSIGPIALYAIWIVRNVFLFTYPSHERPNPSVGDLVLTVENSWNIMGHWALPHLHEGPLSWLVATAVLAIVTTRLRRRDRYSWIFAHFTIIYVLAMILATSVSTIPSMDWRFLSPAFVPLFVTSAWAVDEYHVKHPGIVEYLVLFWFVIWITAPNAFVDLVIRTL